jgi:hypothetical protein
MRTVIQILYAAFLAVILGLFIALIPTPYQPYPIQGCEDQENTYRPEKSQSVTIIIVREVGCFIHKNRDDIAATSTLTIAIFTIVLVIFTVRLARATKIAALAAKDSADILPALERAYMFPGFTTENPFFAGGTIRVHLLVINQGKTPGFLKETCGRFTEEEPSGEIATYEGGEIHNWDNVIPGDNKPLELDQFYRSPMRGKKIFFSGYIRYKDIFGKLHTSRICAAFTNGQISFQTAGTPVWSAYD